MNISEKRKREVIIALIIIGILCLHYFTHPAKEYYHAVYRMAFYIPLILGGLWFGLKGALIVSAAAFILFTPYIIIHWQGFSIEDFDKVLEGLIYFTTTIILGLLVERERKEHNARLRNESLAAVGRAVSEIAHDMKTPLMAIGGFSKQVTRSLDADNPAQRKLEIIVQETSRLESMVKEMLDFGKPLALNRSETALNDLIHECVEMSEPVAKEAGIELEFHKASPPLPSISLDGPRIKQVLLNLITNAIQASPPGEKVTISATLLKKTILMAVSDFGCGISEELREIIFQPFFTTKGSGTGLGLPIVKRIVEAHGGNISFTTNPEKGVTFPVYLPLTR